MTKTKSLTENEINEFRKKIVHTESINNYYYNNWEKFYKELTCEDDLPDEKWKHVPYYTGRKVEASNKGRIRINDEIVGKKNYYYYEEEIKKLDKKLLKDATTKNKVGYLKVKGLGLRVYQMVANAWLGYEPGTGFLVHHITNDGYDNRPENLVLLSKSDHNKVHHTETGEWWYGEKVDDYKPAGKK